MPIPSTPLLSVDILIRSVNSKQRIVLIERKNPPHGWALPGGFVDVGETVAAAAVREALEETSCKVELTALLGCYSTPQRDQRGHTVSLVYLADTSDDPVAADDAANLAWFDLDAIPDDLCFDHETILADYQNYLQNGTLPPLTR